ncbi:hypothetical protein PXW85_24250, partial [Klebsiella pneumoniae]|nr:hypothetical protein [Klebsiella pneumoniae]
MPNAHPDLWQRYQATKAASTAKYARDIAAEMGISEAGLWKLPGLAQTPAGRHKQLLTIDDMALLGFGPRTPQAIIA